MKNEELERLDLNGWPLSDEYLIELGRVSLCWASLESLLNLCVGKLAGFDGNDVRSFILVNHSSFQQRLDMLGALCEQHLNNYPSLVEYRRVVGTLKSAQTVRNRLMHNGMALNADTGKVEMPTGSARGSVKVSVEVIELVDIRRAALQIHEAVRALYKLVLGKSRPSIVEERSKRTSAAQK